MCGIFAYMGHKPLPILQALEILRILESEQEPDEKSPVGGHGAGIACLNKKGELRLQKVGKTKGSPIDQLQLLENNRSGYRLILGHVRRASPEFQNTIPYKECTQPYQPNCTHSDFHIATAHNGFLQNYQQLKNTLIRPHQYESQRHTLIDSEVIAHLTEELLTQTKDTTKATHILYQKTKGTKKQGNTIVTMVHSKKRQAYLHAIQKGKTRGLIIWTNSKGEVILCSREQPVDKILNQFLSENNLQKAIRVTSTDTINLEAHFTLKIPQPT